MASDDIIVGGRSCETCGFSGGHYPGCDVQMRMDMPKLRIENEVLKLEVRRQQAEIERLRVSEWSYDSLTRILSDELPLTMTLGLASILVKRMVRERMFAERVGGVVSALTTIASKEVSDDE